MKTLAYSAIVLSVSFSAAARIEESPGFSGELTALLGATYEKSNFNTNNQRKTGPANTVGQSETEFLAVPLGQLRFTFGRGQYHQIFVGTSREDISVGDFALELGYKVEVGRQSSMAFSYLPSLAGETFADPYLLNQDRKVVDVSSDAYRIKYNNVFSTPFSLDVAYYTVDLDEELSGSTYGSSAPQLLDRKGNGLYSKLSFAGHLSPTSIFEPSIVYKDFSADGDAMSNRQLGVELAYKVGISRHALALSATYSSFEYDSENPIFNKTQEDKQMGLFVAYEFHGLAGLDNLAFNAILGYDQTTSNIEFYEVTEAIAGVGSTIKF
ncbi:DUF2860 family protein [Vibrio sp. HN007]|uniref:DUF2860 family protein n=1 Tax=Vibrio iocasae TaxID=3098914 RepID=UPI0035D43432